MKKASREGKELGEGQKSMQRRPRTNMKKASREGKELGEGQE